ncbi:hypothetical protein [Dyadobacter sp. CY312]|uniref:hypothetical protein n=1 Tax=Dyadobacter sp. CY312 TaxID=2907303 RepID=UPI001F262D79|nr:hypothetical protein [Dyadobacter sp. CY312]MCE7038810.1 hypothetical protein [Dyadobacter sp. CY312]
MKLKEKIIAQLFLSVLILTSCSRNKDLKVSVKDSDTEFIFTAHYDRKKTVEVQQYVNKMLKPNRIFADHEEDAEKDIKLANGTTFHVESTPGDMLVKFNKQDNNNAAYQEMRELCQGIREIVVD